MRDVLEFQELLEIVEHLNANTIFNFKYFDAMTTFKIEYLDEFTFSNARHLLSWIPENLKLIAHRKKLLDIDYLMQEEYYLARLKDVDEIYLAIKENDAILVRCKVSNSTLIDCSTYEKYKQSLYEAIL